MLIGEDFEKIKFDFLGFNFLEPNAFFSDTFIAIFSIYAAIKCSSYFKQTNLIFFKHWKHFFYVFGIGYFFGGLGHFCYGYWGIPGKIPGWYTSGILSPLFIELAMSSLLSKERYKKLVPYFMIKTAIICIIQVFVIVFVELEKEPGLGLIGPLIAMLTALPFWLGVYGYRFSKSITPKFKYLWWSLVVFSPSLIFLILKINIHQWLDKNDVGHILLIVNTMFYFLAVKGYFYFQTRTDEGKKSIEARGSLS